MVFLNLSSAIAPSSHRTSTPSARSSRPRPGHVGATPLPASFESRRQALNLSQSELGTFLGVSGEEVAIIESVPLGADVEFLHNLTLSLLELAGK